MRPPAARNGPDANRAAEPAMGRGEASLDGGEVHARAGDGTFIERLRRQPETVMGPLASVVLHALLLIIAAILVINPPVKRGEGPGEVAIEFSTLSDEELTELADSPLDAIDSPIAPALEQTDPVEIDFNADVVASTFESSESTPIETLGGAGESVETGGAGDVLSGGGGGTSFFGVEAKGKRFLYIVDISGSMLTGDRMSVLERNLHQSITDLAPYTSFFVIAFSDDTMPIDPGAHWIKADDAGKLKAQSWIRKLGAGGGTEPANSFDMAFRFDPRPDVIFFMTDGLIAQGDALAKYIETQNARGRKTRINTICFGERGSGDLLQRIAENSGGKYRYVEAGQGDGG